MEEIIIVFVCLVLNALFAAFEMAFVSVPKAELKALAKAGRSDAQLLLSYRDMPERALSIIQIGITLVGAIAAAVGGAGASDFIEPYFIEKLKLREVTAEILAVLVVVAPITFLNVVAGELVPKTLALRNPIKIVLTGARWFFWSAQFLAPVVLVFEWTTKMIVKIFFSKTKVVEEQTLNSIDLGGFSPVHQKILLNMADIETIRVKDIVLPWSQVNFVKLKDSIEEVTAVVLSSGHTRLPVVDDNRVVGVLHTKEFMALRETGERVWQSIMRNILQVKSTDSAFGVMRLMQEKHSHMAVASTIEGECLGIVTLEDILEEVIGDVFDEDDDGKIRKIFAMRAKVRPHQFDK